MNEASQTCSVESIARFLGNRLTPEEQTMLESHLDHCDDCCDRLRNMTADAEQWSQVEQHLSDAFDAVLPAPTTNRRQDIPLDFLNPTDDPHMLGRFAGYEIAGVIGVGGMGIVLKGFDRSLNRYVAIKVLLPHYASSAAARKRFSREARAAAAVVHDNVIEIYSVSVEENETYLPHLVMPYIRGESLQKRLDRCGVMTTAETLRIATQVASGLAAAHEQGLVHRDIKPANILLLEDVERVKITDFGLARAADDASLTRTGVIAGTPQYMSPEQAEGKCVTAQSDLFSLGSVMYSMCSGRVPFRAESPLATLRRIVDDQPRPIQQINPDVPGWLCQIIAKLHAKDPEHRFASAGELAQVLKQCLAHVQQPDNTALPPEVNPRSQTKSTVNSTFNHRLILGGLAMMTFLLLGIFGLSYWPAATPAPEEMKGTVSATQEKQDPYSRRFTATFADHSQPRTLNVDIKRGAITVVGHDEEEVVVELEVPNYTPKSTESGGLRELRPNNLDFHVTTDGNDIKVDSNSERYITNLKIKVPYNVNLKLDSYRDGELRVSNVHGHLDVRSFHNDITLHECSGSVDLWSYHGNLIASLKAINRDKSLKFESYNGSIDVSLPEDIKANTRLRTKFGKLLTNLEITEVDDPVNSEVREDGTTRIEFDKFVHGQINGGGQLLQIETQHGDIRIRKYEDVLGERLGREWNEKLGKRLGEEWNEKLGEKLGREWDRRLNRESSGK